LLENVLTCPVLIKTVIISRGFSSAIVSHSNDFLACTLC